MRLAIIGCGSIGKRHLRNLKHLGFQELLAFDIQESRCQEVQKEYGVPAYRDRNEILDQRPQVAFICTPTRSHLEDAVWAARAGCHLFIEKPVADSLEGAAALLDLVEQRRLLTMVGCTFRFHPGLRQAKALVDQGALGTIISARAQFGQYLPDWHPWEDYRQGYSARRDLGGGVLLDRIHELDYLRWLLGEVTEVGALMGHLSHLEIDTEDTVEVLLRFARGAFGSIHLDYVRRLYDCSLEIIGDQGLVRWSYQDHRISWYLARDGVWSGQAWPRYDGNAMYLEQLRNFFQVLEGKESSALTAAEGYRVLAIALAAREAAAAGKFLTV